MLLLMWILALVNPSSGTCGLSLQIQANPIVVRPGEPIRATAVLTNNGSQRLTLVLPGDGSVTARRTPVIKWTVDPPREHGILGCGNINSLKKGEVFVLPPGEARSMSAWMSPQFVLGSGTYRATVTYSNEPDRVFSGIPLGSHDEAELARLRGSDRCTVTSSEIEITVQGKPVEWFNDRAVEQ